MRDSSPARAESRTTGVSRIAGSSRTARSSPKPSSPGIMMSVTTSAGGRARRATSAAPPSATASTSQRDRSRRVTYSRMSALSSATRMRSVVAGGSPARGAPVLSASRGSASGSQPSASSRKRSPTPPGPAPEDVAAIRSAGRCATPRGRVTVNALPRPGVLSTRTEPPCSRTSS